MRQKRLIMAILILTGIGLTGLHAQKTLNIKQRDGKEAAFPLNGVQKLTFPKDEMIVTNTDGSSHLFTLSHILLMRFSETITAISPQPSGSNGSMLIYPNPVTYQLTVIGKSTKNGKILVDIINIKGEVVHSEIIDKASATDQLILNLSTLPKGLYICRLRNGLTSETGRFIKN